MSIKDQPHYELHSTELAKWVEQQGPNHCWSIDDELSLLVQLGYPIAGEKLAAVLRERNRPLLLADKDGNPAARGQVVTAQDLDRLADTWGHFFGGGGPTSSQERLLHLCWKGKDTDWNLNEDLEETALYARDLRREREWEEEQARAHAAQVSQENA